MSTLYTTTYRGDMMNKKHMRRGQAAMEFLMTYGWAILVVLAAIGALAYFGVLSPDNFLPERCTTSPEFGCIEHQAREGGDVSLGIQNNVGSTLSNVTVSLLDPADGEPLCSTTETNSTSNGQRIGGSLVELADCHSLETGDRFQADMEFVYQESNSDLVHTRSGTLQTVVQ